jgi:hypothetical protein
MLSALLNKPSINKTGVRKQEKEDRQTEETKKKKPKKR